MIVSPTHNLGDVVRTDSAGGGFLDLADGRCITLPDLDRLAGRLAAGLAARFGRGDRVAILAANGAPFIVVYLALMRAGLVAVPINHRLPAETIAVILADCAAQAVFADRERAASAGQGLELLPIEALEMLMAAEPMLPVRPGEKEIAEILYTSGSTGGPKGVPLSHAGQLWALEQFLAISSRATERAIIVAPAYHMSGLFFTTVTLALGYLTISMPRFEARAYLEAVAAHRATLLSGIPTMFALMARERALIDRFDLSSVTEIIIGSAPLNQALVDRVHAIFPNAVVRNSYGTTETGPTMFGPHPDGRPRPELALGYPYPGVEWRLAGKGDEGALETRTPATLSAYLNLPEATAERVRDGWYKTGDVVRRDAGGFFHFVGRADDMFVCGGENVHPAEAETLLLRHPTVMEAVVLPVPDEVKGMIPIAFVVPSPGARIDVEALRQFTLAHGPAYSHPRAIEVLDVMPTGGTHKIDRSALARRALHIGRALGRDGLPTKGS